MTDKLNYLAGQIDRIRDEHCAYLTASLREIAALRDLITDLSRRVTAAEDVVQTDSEPLRSRFLDDGAEESDRSVSSFEYPSETGQSDSVSSKSRKREYSDEEIVEIISVKQVLRE